MSKGSKRRAKARIRRNGLKGSVGKSVEGRARGGTGPACRNCSNPTVRWVHSDSWAPTPGVGYFTEWYECITFGCRTRQIMPPEFYVSPHTLGDAAEEEEKARA